MTDYRERFESLLWEQYKKEHPSGFERDSKQFERCFRILCKFPAQRKASDLEKVIKKYLEMLGYQCSKITTSGVFVKGSNAIGVNSIHGKTKGGKGGKYIPGGSTKGVADLIATVYGLKLDIEVKFSRGDKQRDTQKKYEQKVTDAGGVYIIVRSFEDFCIQFEQYLERPEVIMLKGLLSDRK